VIDIAAETSNAGLTLTWKESSKIASRCNKEFWVGASLTEARNGCAVGSKSGHFLSLYVGLPSFSS
jgi:hypothetical protein